MLHEALKGFLPPKECQTFLWLKLAECIQTVPLHGPPPSTAQSCHKASSKHLGDGSNYKFEGTDLSELPAVATLSETHQLQRESSMHSTIHLKTKQKGSL